MIPSVARGHFADSDLKNEQEKKKKLIRTEKHIKKMESDAKRGSEKRVDKKQERNYNQDFEINGVRDAAIEISNDLKRDFSLMMLRGINSRDEEGVNYKERVLRVFVKNYGEEKISKLIQALAEISILEGSREKKLRAYNYYFSGSLKKGNKADWNRKFYNLADILAEDGIKELEEVFKKLRQEGYQSNYDFRWGPNIIQRLLNDREERIALIKIDEIAKRRMDILMKLQSLLKSVTDGGETTYKEVWSKAQQLLNS